MSIKTKIAAFALAASIATGALASSTHQADAKPFGLGWAFEPASSAARSPPATTDSVYGYGR
jgi:hypothetical protein